MSEPHPGRKALQHFERVLEQQPKKDDHELSVLTRCLGALREELIALNRSASASAETRECLAHMNAVVTVAMGMHFPLGPPPWGEFEKAKHWLQSVVERVEGLAA